MCAALPNRRDPTDELELAVRLMNETTAGITGIKTGVHVCRGNWSRREDVLLSSSGSAIPREGLASPWAPQSPLRSLERPVRSPCNSHRAIREGVDCRPTRVRRGPVARSPRRPARTRGRRRERTGRGTGAGTRVFPPDEPPERFASLSSPGLVVLGGCADPVLVAGTLTRPTDRYKPCRGRRAGRAAREARRPG